MLSRVVTVEMKMEFVEKVKKLTNEGLTRMVNMVQEYSANSISDIENDKIQIKIDDFDYESFLRVNQLIEEILSGEQPSKR
jgi:arginyl-tRNA synthetase